MAILGEGGGIEGVCVSTWHIDTDRSDSFHCFYRSGTVNLQSFIGKDFHRNKWKYELTMNFRHEMIGK